MTRLRRALQVLRRALSPRPQVVVQHLTINAATLPTIDQLKRMQRAAEQLGG